MSNSDYYIDKVKKFNEREDYDKDVEAAQLFLKYCLPLIQSKKIFVVGTGLGGDIKIIKDIKNFKITGIEPRQTFHDYSLREYKKIGGELLKMDLGEFVKTNKSLSGIFLFIHSINHIPKKQIELLKKSMKNSYIIILNPNPKIGKIVGKTDKTVISYLNSKQIQKLLNAKVIFDFFYNLVKIDEKEILLREAILLKYENKKYNK
jgi:hypothetical protein